MGLASLLISRDTTVLRVLRPTLEKLSITVELCSAARSGTELLTASKFDAVIVDCDDLQGGVEILQGLRRTRSNKNSVAFAILNGKTTTRQAFEMGANFVLQKPISPLNATRCFDAALTFMDRERRRYFRHPVEMPVGIMFSHGTELKTVTSNLSEGGMAIRFPGEMPKEMISKIQFTLPGSNTSLELKAEVAWADKAGRAGLRFIDVPQSSQHQLESCLTRLLEDASLLKVKPAKPATAPARRK
jgi:CheY-like chemotaxis protein